MTGQAPQGPEKISEKKPEKPDKETWRLAEIEAKLKAYVPPAESGDYALNPDLKDKQPPGKPLRDAAVLILLIERDDGLTVLFTERTKTLHAHAGQISFPGGGVEEDDADSAGTALREASEEIGLVPANARVLGQLEDYVTRTGFRVTPVIAVLEKDQAWTPNPGEVAVIFEVPLSYILANLAEESLNFEGGERRFYACTFETHHIWGATAGMLNSLKGALETNPPAVKKPALKNNDPKNDNPPRNP